MAGFDPKILFSSLILGILLVATSAIGIQKYDEDKQGGTNKTFLIVTLVFGLIGVLMALVGGGLTLKNRA